MKIQEAERLSKRYMILPILLIFIFNAGLSLGQTDNNMSAMENITKANETAAGNATVASTGPNVNYIWSVTGIESGQVTMVLQQDGSDLLGRAKYEPEGVEPWNGEVSGSIVGDKVELVLTALKGKDLVNTRMSGTFANESISGNFTQSSGGKIIAKGEFSAMWINPDTSAYSPAVIEEPKTAASESNVTEAAEAANQTSDQAAAKKSRFVDVRQYKDKIGPGGDLSGVPPGMGGSMGA